MKDANRGDVYKRIGSHLGREDRAGSQEFHFLDLLNELSALLIAGAGRTERVLIVQLVQVGLVVRLVV